MFKRFKYFRKNYILLFVIFLTGAAVLVVEVTATRILSVYFGNTIFTVSSVLSVILLALSLGYYLGGRLADKRPSELLFFQLIALSGLSVFLLQFLNSMFIPMLSTTLDMQYGPIIVSLILFLLPGFLLGMLSPLVAKLQTIRMGADEVGRITGDVFFWSTLGSIIGSLATGFVLIPLFGVTEIILGTGVLLLIIGSIGMAKIQKNRLQTVKLLTLIITISFIQICLSFLADKQLRENVVYANDGLYDNIVIFDGMLENHPTRFLQQSTDASSAMYKESTELVYEYTKYYRLYTLTKPDITRAMVIGGGAYSIPKDLLLTDKDVIVDVAEIEPEMYELAKDYFNVPNDNRLVNYVGDGRRFLQETDQSYDLIFGDAYHTSIPSHLTTQEFLRLTKSKLTKDGVFIMNAIGRLRAEKPSYLLSQIKTFISVYPYTMIFAVHDKAYNGPQNIILAGFKSEKPINPGTFADNKIEIGEFDLESHPLFTDNYAPVEYFNVVNNLR